MATPVGTELLVLDSWPVLEWIKGREPAYSGSISLVERAMKGEIVFHMSRINYGEAIYTIRKAPDIPDTTSALQKVRSAPMTLHSVDDALVEEAVDLKSLYAFSFADAFAAALAIRTGARLVTGDPEFIRLEGDRRLRLFWLGA